MKRKKPTFAEQMQLSEAHARHVFDQIESIFPDLEYKSTDKHPHCDIVNFEREYPKQTGLDFEVWLSLQNGDELYLSTNGFHCSWFPCADEPICQQYLDAVYGVMSGSYRFLEIRSQKKTISSRLQASIENDWTTIASSGVCFFPSWFGRKEAIVQNNSCNQVVPTNPEIHEHRFQIPGA